MITILVQLKKTEKILGYEYYHVFHGYVSKLLGNEKYGQVDNDYVYSNICGGRCTDGGFYFPSKPYFFIRTNNDAVLNNFLSNLSRQMNIMEGFIVDGFTLVDTDLSSNIFETDAASPILVSKKYRRVENLSKEEILDTERYLVNSIKHRARELNTDIDENLSIKILSQRRSRNIKYRGFVNKCRNFRLRIDCDNETKEFILTHGIGRSTSCGFGFLI